MIRYGATDRGAFDHGRRFVNFRSADSSVIGASLSRKGVNRGRHTYRIVVLGSALTGCAALANLVGHDYAKRQADKLRMPRWLIPVAGTLLGADCDLGGWAVYCVVTVAVLLT